MGKIYVGIDTKRYTELDYIEAVGYQYIDTGFLPTKTTRIVMQAEPTDKTTYSMNYLFGTTTNGAGYDYFSFMLFNQSTSKCLAWSSYFNMGASTQLTYTTYDIDFNSTSATVNSTVITQNTTQTASPSGTILIAGSRYNTSYYYGKWKIYYCKIYESDTLIMDLLPCIDPSGTVGMYDKLNDKFYSSCTEEGFVAGNTTGETIYLGSLARLVKNGYIGVSNVARRILKAYVGVAGVARPIWGGYGATRWGNISMSGSYCPDVGASNGAYALFGSGYADSSLESYTKTVYAYDESLIEHLPSTMYAGASDVTAGRVGNYALFAGGRTGTESETKSITTYDTSLTRGSTSLSQARGSMTSANVGNYVLFSGGYIYSDNYEYTRIVSDIDVFDTSLTRSTLYLNSTTYSHHGASTTNHAFFVGGVNTADFVHEAFDASLTSTQVDPPGYTGYWRSSVSFGDYALFAGGHISDVVDAYDDNLTHTSAPPLSIGRAFAAPFAFEDYACFAGGRIKFNGSEGTPVVDAYDKSLTRWSADPLDGAYVLGNDCTAQVGKYALLRRGVNTIIVYIE